jgi:DNA-binding IclR family transcriptional regulator
MQTNKALILEVAQDQRLQYSARLILIWILLNPDQDHYSNHFLYQRLGLDKSTASVTLARLVATGYLQIDETLGRGWFSLAPETRNKLGGAQ